MDTEKYFDIKYLFRIFVQKWYVFAICLALFLIIGEIFIKIATPKYSTSISILVNEDQSSSQQLQSFISSELLKSFTTKKIKNEIRILKSRTLIYKTLKKCHFEVGYKELRKWRNKILYKQESPFCIEFDFSHVQPINLLYNVSFNNDGTINIRASSKDVPLYDYQSSKIIRTQNAVELNKIVRNGDWIHDDYCSFKIIVNDTSILNTLENRKFTFNFDSYFQLYHRFNSYNIMDLRESTIVEMTLTGSHPEMICDFFNILAETYQQKEIEHKNIVTDKVIGFIEGQLLYINDSLSVSEIEIQDYRKNKSVVNADVQIQKLFEQIDQNQQEKAKLVVKLNYYNYLKEYLIKKDSLSDFIAPSILDIDEPVINKLLIDLSDLYSEQTEISYNTVRGNPMTSGLKKKIDNIQRTILQHIYSAIDKTKIAINNIDLSTDNISKKAGSYPETQRKLLQLERKFKLNESLFNYLMTVRSEMQITKASNIPSNEIVDDSDPLDVVFVYPNKKTILGTCILLALLLPMLLYVFVKILYDRIEDIEDIETLTTTNIIGFILHYDGNNRNAVIDNQQSVVSESFRTLRTNIQFVEPKQKNKTILVTSSNQFEGKSFNSFNLASTYALLGYKTVLLGFDLRKPVIPDCVKTDNKKGLSIFLSNSDTAIDDYILDTPINDLYFIPSGPVPPNPVSLVSGKKMHLLFELLKQKFDYVIIDTPPVGLVSDAILLAEYSDVQLLVVRHNYTHRKMLSGVIDNLSTKKINNLNIIVNDIRLSGFTYGYGNSYGYGHVYGYGNTDVEKKKTFFRKYIYRS